MDRPRKPDARSLLPTAYRRSRPAPRRQPQSRTAHRPLPSAASVSVVAGALFDAQGRVLIAQRPPGKALAGRWEFPGGKLDDGEDAFAGLAREIREELGVAVAVPRNR